DLDGGRATGDPLDGRFGPMHRGARADGGARPHRRRRARAHRGAGGAAGDRRPGGGRAGRPVDRSGRPARGHPAGRSRGVRRRRPGDEGRPVNRATRGPRPGQGVAGGPPRTSGLRAASGARSSGEGGRSVTPILVAAATGLLAALLGTPIAIRLFRAWGWGQRIREDGPQGHLEKMGTPTMGGIVIIGGMVTAYLVARVRTPFTRAGLAVLGAAVGLGIVGALDDLLKIWRQRSLGLNKITKIVGQALVAVGFALAAVHLSRVTTDISFIRPLTGL